MHFCALERVRHCLLKSLLFVVSLIALMARAHAQSAPLIEAVDVRQADSHVDLILQFTCSMRYLAHDPSSTGASVRIRVIPGRDCDSDASLPFAVERPVIADRDVVKTVLLEQVFAGELALTIEWTQDEHFVLAPSADLRGIRIRLLRPGKPENSRVMIADAVPETTGYAINLDSSTETFDQQTIADARTLFGTEPYDSKITLNGQSWHRLRVGPFSSRAEAQRALVLAKTRFSRAWLAIADETRTEDVSDVLAPVPPTRTNPNAVRLSENELDALVRQARQALQKRQYELAITLFTKAVEQPEFPARADALESLGLARERNRQLAHAKAEYEEYLRLYPRSPNATRVRQRLGTLLAAHLPGADRATADDAAARKWRAYGGAGVRYQYDTSRLQTDTEKQSFIAQHAAITDLDLVARKHGERFDFLSRVSAGYQKDLLSDGPGDRTRIGITYAEMSDQEWHWSARLGRQSRTSAGVLGSFDGISLGYQLLPRIRANVIYGRPVESSYDSLQTDRTLTGVSFDFGTFARAWDISIYATRQSDLSLTDRQAIGTEVRFFQPGRSIIGLVDYDTLYSTINTVVLLGVLELPARWTVSFDVDRRNAPLLTTRNALIGQPVEDLATLQTLFSDSEIRQLAEDRTARADTYSISVTRPLSERFRVSIDASSTSISSTPESGGVASVPTSGNVQSYSVQLLGGGWIARDDFNVLGVRYQTGGDSKVTSLAYYTRFALGTAWRIGPRIRVDQQTVNADGSKRLQYIPSLRTDYLGKHLSILTELGAQLGSRTGGAQREDSSDYFVSLQGRWNF
jgi:tetratricopeptide (TPR) repeat protein